MSREWLRSDSKFINWLERIAFLAMLLSLLYLVHVTIHLIDFSRPAFATALILSLLTAFLCALLYYFCISGYSWDAYQQRVLEFMLIVFYISNALGFFGTVLDGNATAVDKLMLINTLLYVLSAVYWIAFWFFQKNSFHPIMGVDRCQTFLLAYMAVYAIVSVVNHFTGFCYYIDTSGNYVYRSPLLVIMTALWFIIYIAIALTSKSNAKTKFALASYALMPLIGWLLIIVFKAADFYLDILTNLNLFLYLISIYLLFFNIYIEHGQKMLQRDKELTQSRANAMMLKISPHFIANTMSSIVALCDSDADKAGNLAAKFAKYLRDNYVDITEDPMVTFGKELEHIENYLAIEQMRFEKLYVEYDIQVDNFMIPTLTVQPLVENAVRHGISKRPDAAGILRIETRQDQSDYVIRIIDDGVGYVKKELNDGRNHIGIANARYRLETLCNGTLTITGIQGVGTTCEIRIPVNNERK